MMSETIQTPKESSLDINKFSDLLLNGDTVEIIYNPDGNDGKGELSVFNDAQELLEIREVHFIMTTHATGMVARFMCRVKNENGIQERREFIVEGISFYGTVKKALEDGS